MVSATLFNNEAGLKDKALYSGTPFYVIRQVSFGDFVEHLKNTTTVVPYVPKNEDIHAGALSTKNKAYYPVLDNKGNVLPNAYLTRSAASLSDRTSLLCIDFDMHLMLEVYTVLTGRRHKLIDNIPDEHTIKELLFRIGLDTNKLNHVIYKSSSYGKLIDKKTGIVKTNMHAWFELAAHKTIKDVQQFVAAIFSRVDAELPQKLIGLNKQGRRITKPMMPDMAVYSKARLIVQGLNVAERIISMKIDGYPISQYVFKKLIDNRQPVQQTHLYDDISVYEENHKTYNKLQRTKLTQAQFRQKLERLKRQQTSGELYIDDMIYKDNKPYMTYAGLLDKIKREEASDTVLFAERSDITMNISDINDPEHGKKDNCYLVIKPDDTMAVYHFSEERWYRVIHRVLGSDKKVKIIKDKYIPSKGIKSFYKNHCIIAPTGTGKTYHVLKKACYMLQDRLDKTTKIIWTVPDYAALHSIESEAQKLIPNNIKFKALKAGVDKFSAYDKNDIILVTPDKLTGDLHRFTSHLDTSSPVLFDPTSLLRHKDINLNSWTFIIDEVHTLFGKADSEVNQFMYYRILQREFKFNNLIVMSADMLPELLPGNHDRAWLETSQVTDTEWRIDKYDLAKPRHVYVTYNFPWEKILQPKIKALILAPSPNKAVGIYEEVVKVNKGKVMLYLGLPRNITEMTVQQYPYKQLDGSIAYREYARPSHDELLNADVVIATALTAGTSLSNKFDYCVVDMVGIPHTLEAHSVEVQKISRARHADVERILVISNTRFDRNTLPPLKPLRTIPDDMLVPDYTNSKILGVNKHLTNYLTPEKLSLDETDLFKKAKDVGGMLFREVAVCDADITVEPRKAVYDVLKEASTYFKLRDKILAQTKTAYQGAWGLGFEASFDETEKHDSDRGKAHLQAVKDYKKYVVECSWEEYLEFMKTPPVNKAMDKAQQDLRKVEVPEEPVSIAGISLTNYAKEEERIKLVWNLDFYRQMHKQPGLAKKAKKQNDLFLDAGTKFIVENIERGTYYPMGLLRRKLKEFIRTSKTREAIDHAKDPRMLLSKLGRVSYYQIPQVKGIVKRGHPKESDFKQIKKFNERKVTHFCFELGWFDLDNTDYVIAEVDTDKPVLNQGELKI
jgi:hypothetical protein